MAEKRKRSYQITHEGITLIDQISRERGWVRDNLKDVDKTGIESIERILRNRKAERNSIELIAKAFDISPSDLVDSKEWYRLTESIETISSIVDWRSVSKRMLEDLKRLTTEALTTGDGIRFNFDDIFVPLGVVERREKTKRKKDDGAPDRGSELYEEKVTPITHDEFFEDVLLRGNTRYSNGKRIAVIGEAGAGKTTQLQKIGSWLLEESDDTPVWISLTDLGAKSLKEYLFENWVREASGEIEAAPQPWKDSLGDAIASGKVWLLLDGVDEMTVNNSLSYLATQLKESWLKNVRVVLTCRVNVWDGGKNALTGFDVYRNLDFDYPDDVYKFIGKWFVRNPELAGSLTQALEQLGKERIRDMVKNPLRLTLLCYSWQLKQGELPETKAGLYEWFVEAFYKWNKGKAQIELSRSQEDELNLALGELAKRAIDGEASRFRLTKTFIKNVLREFNIDLFDLALKLNWLNEIGVAAENPLETVYAFYHPSFQEYFAALAIDDWDFFLPRDHVNKPVQEKQYRVFESSWQEVILLWSGISKDLNKSNEINLFIDKLLTFQDGCSISNDYRDLGHFIGLDITIESNNLRLFDIILDQIIEWAFGYLEQSNQVWIYNNHNEAKYKLRYVPKEILINKISKLLSSISSENIVLDVVNFLLSINTNNSVTLAVEYLLKLGIKSVFKERLTGTMCHIQLQHRREIIARDPYLTRLFVEFIYSLDLNFRYIVFGNIQEDTLSKLIYSPDSNESIYLLEKLFIDNPNELINTLTIFNWSEFRFIPSEHRLEFTENNLSSIDLKNLQEKWEQINTLSELELHSLMEEDEDETEEIIYCTAHENITGYIPYLPIHVNSLENTNYHYSDIHEQSFNIILRTLKMEEIVDTHDPFAFAEIDYGEMSYEDLYKVAVENLSRIIKFCDDEFDYYYCYRLLFNCAQNISYPSFYSSWYLLYNLEFQIIDCEAIQKELDRNTDYPEIRCLVVDIHQLEQESDPNVIAEEIAIKIFDSLRRKIPEIQRVSSLKRELLNLKFDLGVEILAIALYGNTTNEAINQLCQSLTLIQIRLFIGEKSTQEFTKEVKDWLRRINLEYN